jgi:hypothetical protein
MDNANAEGDSSFGEIKDLDNANTVTLDDTGNDAVNVNKSGEDYIMYAWKPIAGYSAFGEYDANNIADNGPFVYTGFRPAYVLSKRKDSNVGANWSTNDIKRGASGGANGGGNPYNTHLYANGNYADWAHDEAEVDFLSNGFKIRGNGTGTMNRTSTAVYIYICFAEHPFKTARAR